MGLVSHKQNILFDPKDDRRAQERARLELPGKIFSPNGQYEVPCLVLDLSPDGAGLKTACTAKLGSRVVLYVDGLGRFEGTIVRHNRLYVGVEFKYSDTTRKKITARIRDYLERGTDPFASKRNSPRLAATEAPYSFKLESGQTHACDIVDIALSGASFKTTARPGVGVRVFFGKTAAVVVRHTNAGFAVEFSDSNTLI